MVAAPYKVSMALQNAKGQRKSIYLTASDVNAAAWVFPSGGTELAVSAVDSVITDLIYSAAGTDTSQVAVYLGGIDTGLRIVNAANTYNTIQRQVATTPITIPAGIPVKLVQLT